MMYKEPREGAMPWLVRTGKGRECRRKEDSLEAGHKPKQKVGYPL